MLCIDPLYLDDTSLFVHRKFDEQRKIIFQVTFVATQLPTVNTSVDAAGALLDLDHKVVLPRASNMSNYVWENCLALGVFCIGVQIKAADAFGLDSIAVVFTIYVVIGKLRLEIHPEAMRYSAFIRIHFEQVGVLPKQAI